MSRCVLLLTQCMNEQDQKRKGEKFLSVNPILEGETQNLLSVGVRGKKEVENILCILPP